MRPLLLASFSLLLAACNSKDAAELSHDVGKVAKTATRAAGNAQLAGRVNATLAQRKGVDMSGLHIESEGGTVTVGGHVRNATEKKTVLDTVEGIRGVEKVVSKLTIAK